MAEPSYIELREPATGKLLAKYDPARRVLEIQRRGVKSCFDLAQLGADQIAPTALPSSLETAPTDAR